MNLKSTILIAALLSSPISGLGPVGGRPAPLSVDATSVGELLRDARAGRLDVTALRAALTELGSAAIPDLFEALSGDDSALDPSLRSIARNVLCREHSAGMRKFLSGLEGVPLSAGACKTALELLGQSGSVVDLPFLVRLASASSRGPTVSLDIRQAFQRALERILDREPEGTRTLAALYSSADPALIAPLVRVVAASRSASRLSDLVRCAGRVTEVDAVLLLEITRLASEAGLRVESAELTPLRKCLDREATDVVGLAALALGALGDAGAVPALIETLSSDEPRVREAASSALGSITSQRLGTDGAAWEAWYQSEMEWWEKDSQAYLFAVNGADSGKAATAIRELSKRRLQTERAAEGLLGGLRRPEPQLVHLTCAALAQLRSPTTVPHLIRCLEHEDASVRRMARTALFRITGRNLPEDARLWSERLGVAIAN